MTWNLDMKVPCPELQLMRRVPLRVTQRGMSPSIDRIYHTTRLQKASRPVPCISFFRIAVPSPSVPSSKLLGAILSTLLLGWEWNWLASWDRGSDFDWYALTWNMYICSGMQCNAMKPTVSTDYFKSSLSLKDYCFIEPNNLSRVMPNHA